MRADPTFALSESAVYNAAMATAVANPPSLPQPKPRVLAVAALAMAILAGLLLIAATSVAIGFLRAAAQERAADNGWAMATGVVTDKRVGRMVYAPSADDPNQLWPTYQLLPQVEVDYQLEGQKLTAWVEVPSAAPLSADVSHHHNIASALLDRFHRGDRIAFYIDPKDGSTLRLAQDSDGGRRLTIAGYSLAGVMCIPALGLLIASGLLWRLSRVSKPRPVVAVQG